MIPDYDAVVIDEAHELIARVTQAATDELAVNDIERASRRSQRWVEDESADALGRGRRRAGRGDRGDLAGPDRARRRPARRGARAGARRRPQVPLGVPQGHAVEPTGDAGLTQAKGMVQEVFVNAERMAANLESDVLWLNEARDRIPARLHVAPLQVWGPMRDKLLTDKTAIFTCATLMLGGDFNVVATSLGLKPTER